MGRVRRLPCVGRRENIKINQNEATLLLGALQAPINHGHGRMSSLSTYCEWTNGILFLSSWKQLCLKVHSACSVVPHFPSLLFRDCEAEANLHLQSISKDWQATFLQTLFLQLCCSTVPSLPDGSIACVSCFMAIYINRSPEYCQLTQHTKSE